MTPRLAAALARKATLIDIAFNPGSLLIWFADHAQKVTHRWEGDVLHFTTDDILPASGLMRVVFNMIGSEDGPIEMKSTHMDHTKHNWPWGWMMRVTYKIDFSGLDAPLDAVGDGGPC